MVTPARRRRHRAVPLCVAAVLVQVGACSTTGPTADPTPPPAAEEELHVAVPGYVDPGDAAYWDAVVAAVPTVRDVVINPDSGPGAAPVGPYVDLVQALRQAGARVVGYVATGYGQRDPATVTADIARWREWYGVTDVFLDEVPAVPEAIPTYAGYTAAVRDGDGMAVLNPGVVPDPGYFGIADAVVTFEDPASSYLGAEPPGWVRDDERAEVWHIVIDTPADQLDAVVGRARQQGVDEVYVTDDVDPNPYDSVPTYWSAKLEAVTV